MGIFEFTWPHPAGEVLITGTFDEWRGSIKLCKNESGLFTALVDLSDAEKVHYKYIVDGNWTVNYDARREYDSSGNENNVLYPEDLKTPVPSIEESPAQEEPVDLETSVPSIEESPALEEPVDLETPVPSIEESPALEEPVDLETPVPSIEESPAQEEPVDLKTPPMSIKESPSQEELAEQQDEEISAPVERTIEPENQPPATNTTWCVSPAMSPLTTPAAPTTHVYTVGVPGATFNSVPKPESAPSTRSSSASSHESHNEKRELFKERTPEKRKEKRRSVILGRILNLFK